MSEFFAEHSSWLIPAVILLAGAILGLLMGFDPGSEAERKAVSLQGKRKDLESQRDVVVNALKQLELEKDKLTQAAYDAERAKLVKWGADVLRALDTDGVPEQEDTLARELGLSSDFLAALEKERSRIGGDLLRASLADHLGMAAQSRRSGGMAPEWRGALWTLLGVGAAATLIFVIAQSSQPRIGDNPITGKQNPAGAQPPGQIDANQEEAELKTRLGANPNDIDALNGLTELAFVSRDLGQAMEYNRRAIAADETDKTARTYKAVLRSSVGMTDEALGLLDEVLGEDPSFRTALVYQGLIAMDAGKPELAVQALEAALDGAPPNPFLQQRLADARRAAGAADAPVVLSGTITLAEGVAPPTSGLVYVSIRSPAGGPPLAAKQLPPGPFPLDFTVTEADAIAMGGRSRPFPDQLLIKIKLDTDGNAMTTEPGAPLAELRDVPKGTEGMSVVLTP